MMTNRFMKGDRVYTVVVNYETGQEVRRWGTVSRDEQEGWDYVDVRFDDWQPFDILVVCWYLFRDEAQK